MAITSQNKFNRTFFKKNFFPVQRYEIIQCLINRKPPLTVKDHLKRVVFYFLKPKLTGSAGRGIPLPVLFYPCPCLFFKAVRLGISYSIKLREVGLNMYFSDTILKLLLKIIILFNIDKGHFAIAEVK